MPLKLIIKVGADSIEADGDITIDEQVVHLVKEWAAALAPPDQRDAQTRIDELAAQADGEVDDIESSVHEHTPTSPEVMFRP